MEHLHGDEVTVRITDAWKDHLSWPINHLGDAYPWLISDGLWVWKALWVTDDQTWIPQVALPALTPLTRRSMSEMFRDEAPDLVVSVHPLFNHIPLRVLRKVLKTDILFVTVVTDLVTAHPAWFCQEVDYCMVPTEPARQRALRYGMPPDRVEVVGLPVESKFATAGEYKPHLRERLHLDPDRPAVLVVGGAEGTGPVYETARAIATEVPNAQLLVVAGRNAALKQKLEAAAWEIPTHIYGFVTNMPELMNASSLLVTKAGPSTIAEAFIAGLPMVIYDFIPGQEEGNLRYVLEHQAGAYASDPSEIACLVREWLRPGNDILERVVANAIALARPEAALVIARRLYHLLTEKQVSRPITHLSGTRLRANNSQPSP
jgi:1,2-diacylglycerol 3-beta-galactosyltransferase